MARRYRFSMRKGVNIPRVVSKITATVLALYAGGIVISELGNVMNGTASPFYSGLTLIGWNLNDDYYGGTTSCYGSNISVGQLANVDNCITATTGTGILAVIGIIGIASIVMEFVKFRM